MRLNDQRQVTMHKDQQKQIASKTNEGTASNLSDRGCNDSCSKQFPAWKIELHLLDYSLKLLNGGKNQGEQVYVQGIISYWRYFR